MLIRFFFISIGFISISIKKNPMPIEFYRFGVNFKTQ